MRQSHAEIHNGYDAAKCLPILSFVEFPTFAIKEQTYTFRVCFGMLHKVSKHYLLWQDEVQKKADSETESALLILPKGDIRKITLLQLTKQRLP